MIEVQDCTMLAFGAYPQAEALLAEYAQESGIDGLPAPKFHEPTYLRLERAGVLHLVVATIDGALVGLIAVLVNINPHYSEKLAVVESFFVMSAHRKSGAGLKLLKRAEEIAKEQGSAGFLLSAPIGSRLERVMQCDKAYRETHRVFFRSLR